MFHIYTGMQKCDIQVFQPLFVGWTFKNYTWHYCFFLIATILLTSGTAYQIEVSLPLKNLNTYQIEF